MERRRTLHTTWRSAVVPLTPEAAWRVVASGEHGSQWYADAAPLRCRGALDRLLLGPGRRQPPPGRQRLETGDRVGFWEVLTADHQQRRLALQARVRAPGEVRLEASVEPDEGGALVQVAIAFRPDGLLGHAYLVADIPAREAVAELTLLHLLVVLRRARLAAAATPPGSTGGSA